MTSIAIRIGCVALGLHCAFVYAQDVDGTARAQRDADNPLRMIIEAGKLKPRRADTEETATPAVATRAVPVKTATPTLPSKRTATLPEVAAVALVPVATDTPAPAQLVVYVPAAQPYNADDYFGVPPPLKGGPALPPRPSAAAPSSSTKTAAAVGVTAVLSSAKAQAVD
jgi:hypothetical protein